MADLSRGGSSDGIAFLIAAYGVYEIIAAACSSPQTGEINAGTRAPTLMKWVHIGLVQAAFLTGIGMAIDERHRKAIFAGATTAAVLMYASYRYALYCGLKNPGPGTEGQAPSWPGTRWA